MKRLFKNIFKQVVSLSLGGTTTGFCLMKTDLSETESILAGAGVYMISATALDSIINTEPVNPYKEACQNLQDMYNDYLEDDNEEELDIPCINDDDDDDDEEDSESDQQTGKEDVQDVIQTPIEVISKTDKSEGRVDSKDNKKVFKELDSKVLEKEFKKELEKEIDKLFQESEKRKPSMTEEEFSKMTKDTPVTENGIHWSQPKHNDNELVVMQDLGIYEDYESRPRKKQKKAKANNHLHKEVSKKKVDKALAG